MTMLQEVFDSAVMIDASTLALYYDMEQVVHKNIDTIKTKGLTDAVYDEYAEVAKKYGVHFVHPKYAGGLKSVETRH